MVRAEGLPLWAVDDPPAAERDAIFAEVRGKQHRRPRRQARRRRHLRPHRRLRGLPGDPRRLPGVVARRHRQRDDGVRRAAGGRARGVPSACIGLSQQGKEECMLPLITEASTTCARGSASRPTRRRPLLRPAVLHAAPRGARGPRHADAARVAPVPRARPAVRRHALYGGPARRSPARLRDVRLGRPAVGLLPLHLPRRHRRARAAAAAPARDGRARPRPGRPRAAAAQRARRAVGRAGRPHAPRAAMVCHGGSGTVPWAWRRRADGRRAALRRPAVERRARRRARARASRSGAIPGRRSQECAKRSCGSPAIRPIAPTPSGSPPRCAPCRRSTRRSASCAAARRRLAASTAPPMN